MGLRCLIGHEYGEPQTSRDRTQRGNEVVTTVREYRECARCGHRRVISENKEVTTEATGGSNEEPAAEASWSAEPASEEDRATADTFARSSSGGHDEPMTAEEDDGVILEDESEPPRRAHGAWPEADVGEAPEVGESDEPEPWPDEERSSRAPDPDEPEPPEPPGPDDDPLDVGPEPTGEPTDEKPTGAASEDAEVLTADAETSTDEIEPSPPPRPDNRNTEFVCPDCGETWPTQNSSLRPGDICPECRRGYLDERVVQ